MKYYLIAGEASGDLHGANLMRAILAKDPEAAFRFWGGDKMAEIPGSKQVEHYKNTAFMGFVEVLKHLPKIFGFIKKCKADIRAFQPDRLICIDYPGFNLRIVPFAKALGIDTVYYISPQVWAWKESRVKKIKQYVDRMLVILPFERSFYQKHNYEVDYVGHPLLDEISANNYEPAIQADRPVIAILPGSRQQEIQSILPTFLSVVHKFPEYQFVLAGLNHINDDLYNNLLRNTSVSLVKGKTYELLNQAEAALVASGTATLETALFKVPMLVAYKGNFLSYHLGKLLVKVPYISLVNLIADRELVREFIQNDLNSDNIESELRRILEPQTSMVMREAYEDIIQLLGQSGASAKAADLIINHST